MGNLEVWRLKLQWQSVDHLKNDLGIDLGCDLLVHTTSIYLDLQSHCLQRDIILIFVFVEASDVDFVSTAEKSCWTVLNVGNILPRVTVVRVSLVRLN